MKSRYYCFLLAVILSAVPAVIRAQDHSRAVLVSACEWDSDSQGNTSKSAFALVFEVGQSTAILYELQDNGRQPIAWMHYGSPDGDEFFEAEGGIQSTEFAREVYLFLTSQRFVFINNWMDVQTIQDLCIVTKCSLLSGIKNPRAN
jgi:hypothetical protein